MRFDPNLHYDTITIIFIGVFVCASFFPLSKILRNRLVPHLGDLLTSKTINVQFPFCGILELPVKNGDVPARIIVTFDRSVGFLKGAIVVMAGNLELGRFILRELPEFTGIGCRSFNKAITLQTNVVIIPVGQLKDSKSLALSLSISQNVCNPDLRKNFRCFDDSKITVSIRGRKRIF